MPLLKKKKLIFIHIPKTGGQSIYDALGGDLYNPEPNKKILWGPDGDYEYSHFTAKEIKNSVSRRIFKTYYKFAMVRNPYDRLISLYFHKKTGCDRRFVEASKDGSLKGFVKELYEKFHLIRKARQIDIAHIRPQSDFVYDDNKNLIVDRIFRFEEYNKIQPFIDGYGGEKLKVINTGQHNPYQTYYTDEIARMVLEMYMNDFVSFGYDVNPKAHSV